LLLKSSFLATQSTIQKASLRQLLMILIGSIGSTQNCDGQILNNCHQNHHSAVVSAGPRRFADLVATQVKSAMEERVIS